MTTPLTAALMWQHFPAGPSGFFRAPCSSPALPRRCWSTVASRFLTVVRSRKPLDTLGSASPPFMSARAILTTTSAWGRSRRPSQRHG